MKKKKIHMIKGLWFYGMSNAGKTFASNYLAKIIKKPVLIIDGDFVRKYISNDLGYALNDRKIQIKRVFGICKISIKSKIFPIISTVYMNKSLQKKLNRDKIKLIEITREKKQLFKKKTYKEKKNIVGVDIKINKLKTKKIFNTGDIKFCKELKKLIS